MVQRYIPAKIAPWQRKWRTMTYFITAGVGYYFAFWQDWTRLNLVPPDHIFARAQRSHRDYLKGLLGEQYVKSSTNPHELVANASLDAKPSELSSPTSSSSQTPQ